jgi:hypothetical protein
MSPRPYPPSLSYNSPTSLLHSSSGCAILELGDLEKVTEPV